MTRQFFKVALSVHCKQGLLLSFLQVCFGILTAFMAAEGIIISSGVHRHCSSM